MLIGQGIGGLIGAPAAAAAAGNVLVTAAIATEEVVVEFQFDTDLAADPSEADLAGMQTRADDGSWQSPTSHSVLTLQSIALTYPAGVLIFSQWRVLSPSTEDVDFTGGEHLAPGQSGSIEI